MNEVLNAVEDQLKILLKDVLIVAIEERYKATEKLERARTEEEKLELKKTISGLTKSIDKGFNTLFSY